MFLKPSRDSVQLLAPSGGWCSLYTHVHTFVGCAAVQLGPSSRRSPSSLHGDQSFLDNRQALPAPQGHGLGILYTTVLRELRLWRPFPGSASVAAVLPL